MKRILAGRDRMKKPNGRFRDPETIRKPKAFPEFREVQPKDAP
jgi:hypothetical protein